MAKTTTTLSGPNGMWIELDKAQLEIEGGTPAMVYKRVKGRLHSGTFDCVVANGELDTGDVQLNKSECQWLDDQQDKVEAWLFNAGN